MHISPTRRRRALRVHYLSQRGKSHKEIAEQLDISQASIRDDLQLVETHWSSIAAAAADDLLLESLQLLHLRLSLALERDEVGNNAGRITPVDYLRARDAQETRLTALAREIRRTAHEVHRRADQRPDQADLYDESDEISQELAESITKSPEIDHPNSMISSPDQEIVPDQASEEKDPPETLQRPQLEAMDTVIREAIEIFPHLNGQSDEQILQFLDQLTDPNTEPQATTPQIYAEAAG